MCQVETHLSRRPTWSQKNIRKNLPKAKATIARRKHGKQRAQSAWSTCPISNVLRLVSAARVIVVQSYTIQKQTCTSLNHVRRVGRNLIARTCYVHVHVYSTVYTTQRTHCVCVCDMHGEVASAGSRYNCALRCFISSMVGSYRGSQPRWGGLQVSDWRYRVPRGRAASVPWLAAGFGTGFAVRNLLWTL